MVVRSRGAALAGRPCPWRAEAAASLCVPWTSCGPFPLHPAELPARGGPARGGVRLLCRCVSPGHPAAPPALHPRGAARGGVRLLSVALRPAC